jgi:hypothetical protein
MSPLEVAAPIALAGLPLFCVFSAEGPKLEVLSFLFSLDMQR